MGTRTILEIAREAAERDNTAPPPRSLFTENTRIARALRIAAVDTMREYLRGTEFVGLSDFHSQWVFSLLPGRFSYQLPPDFLRMIPGTETRGAYPMGLIGPATPQAWAAWLYGGAAVASPMGWRIKNNTLNIEPVPQATELVVIEYISRYPVVSPVKSGDYAASNLPVTIEPVVPRDGWLAPSTVLESPDGSGNITFDETPPGWDEGVWPVEPSEILKRVNPQALSQPIPEVRRPEFTADDDRPVFSDDHVLSLGMTYRLRRALGLPYAEHAADYEAEMAVAAATDAGGARPFRIGACATEYDALPLGGGRWLVS
ncbi:MAG: hypothetical protein LCH92_08140 [Proteobacteria bacterium]|nr:hypothetical protein [Pseudomonadota bacterium]